MSAAGLLFALLLFRHAISEAIHVVIASEPPPARIETAPLVNWEDCGVITTWQPSPNPRRCHMQLTEPVVKAQPIPTMSKEQSREASFWFILAAFAFPLALGAAALISFVLFRSQSAAE